MLGLVGDNLTLGVEPSLPLEIGQVLANLKPVVLALVEQGVVLNVVDFRGGP